MRASGYIGSAMLPVLLAACFGPLQRMPWSGRTGGLVAKSVWSVDLMQTKEAQRERYLQYLDANWARARRSALASGKILRFEVLVTSDTTDAAEWNVMLLTEYPDPAAYANRERIFEPILAAQGETLIDGLSGRGPDNPLKRTIASMVLINPITAHVD